MINGLVKSGKSVASRHIFFATVLLRNIFLTLFLDILILMLKGFELMASTSKVLPFYETPCGNIFKTVLELPWINVKSNQLPMSNMTFELTSGILIPFGFNLIIFLGLLVDFLH